MAYLNANIPIIECYVRGNYLRDQRDSHDDSAVKILKKEIELLKIQIEEIKIKSSNPLAN